MSNTDIKSSEGVPNCKKVIPIYPTRYAVMPSEKGEYLYKAQANLKQDFAKLDKASYCLRSLRKNAYVYIYDPDARDTWSCFYVGESGFYRRNIDTSTGRLSEVDNTALTYIYVNAHEHQPGKVYIGYTDSPYTKKIMKNVEGGKLKTTIMQEIDLKTWATASDANWEATKKPLSETPKVKHTFLTNELQNLSLDYSEKYNTNWSEEEGLNLNISNIKSGQVGANKKLQLTVALYDSIGIASELSQLVGYEVTKLNQFVEQNARKAWVSSTIDELTRRAGRRAYNKASGNAADWSLTQNSIGVTGGAINDAHARIRKAKKKAEQSKISDYHGYNREAERQAFKVSYPKELETIRNAIVIAGQDHKNWLENYAEGSLYFGLMSYDETDDQSYIGLRASFARCIDALPASEAGVDFAKSHLTSQGPTGIFNLPLLGHPAIQDYVDIKWASGKFGEEFANEKLIALTALLEKIPPDNASKSISRTISAITPISVGFTSIESFKRTVYPSTLEALEGVLTKVKSMPLVDFIEEMQKKKSTAHTQTYFRPTSSKQIVNASVTLHYTDEVKVPLTAEQNARKTDLLQRISFWSNVKAGVSGVGVLFGGASTLDALGKLNSDDRNILVNSIGLGSSALATSSATAGLTQVVFEKRERLALTEDSKLRYKELADSFDSAALGLLAAAAIMAGVKNTILAKKASSGRQKNAYIGAAITQTGVAGIATYNLVTKLADAGNKTAVRMVASSAGKWLARLNPYTGIAILIGEAIAYGLEKYAEAHDDDEVLAWINHSIWGDSPDKSWDEAKEQYELNRLYISPKIIKQDWVRWEDFQIILPGYKSQISGYEIKKGSTIITDKGTLNFSHGIATITFKDIERWGDVSVDYWPDKINKSNIKYSAKN